MSITISPIYFEQVACLLQYLPITFCGAPSSESSYCTLNPDTVSDADTQEMTKLLEVISVTDSEVSTIGEGWLVSPSDFSTAEMEYAGLSFHVLFQ